MSIISASILAANHVNLQKDVLEFVEGGGDRIHVDIMDGHYVKNLTFGPKTIADLRNITDLPIDVHLEMFKQEEYIEEFINAGADMITIQLESCLHPLYTINKVKSKGCKVSLAIAPTTSITTISSFIHELDEINIMSVEPGFGGQTFRKEVYEKIKFVKEVINKNRLQTLISVDGGVNKTNVSILSSLGVSNFIIGNGLFEGGNIKESTIQIKKLINLEEEKDEG